MSEGARIETNGHTNNLNWFVRRVGAGVAVSAGILIPLLVLWLAAEVFLIVFGSILLAVALRLVSDFVARHTRLSTRWSITVVIIVFVLLVGGAIFLLGAWIAGQADEMATEIPAAFQKLQDWLRQSAWGRLVLQHWAQVENSLGTEQNVQRIQNAFSLTFSAVGGFLIFLFLGVYLAAEPDRYRIGLLHLLPLSKRVDAAEVLEAVAFSLRWWMLGQFVSMAFLGSTTTLLLWFAGVPFAFMLGGFVALLTFIPYIGPVFGYFPIALLTLTQDPGTAALVLGVYLVLQTAEGYFVTPMVHRKVVSLPPAMTLAAELTLGTLAGVLGFVLATPLLVVTMVAAQRTYVKWLGDRSFA
jgi:predicted PurR-regulated permease PerM